MPTTYLERLQTTPRRLKIAVNAARRAFTGFGAIKPGHFPTIAELDAQMEALIDGGGSYAGEVVNAESALSLSALWNGVLQISQMIASTKFLTYRFTADGKERAIRHPLYRVLDGMANAEMTSHTYKEISTQHCLLWGNHYAEKQFNEVMDVVALWPINPEKMKPVRNKKTGQLEYELKRPNGGQLIFPAWKIFHMPGMGFDGLMGYSVLNMASNSLGTSIASEKHAGSTFRNGASIKGVLKHPGKLDRRGEGLKNLRESWQAVYGGAGAAGKVAILEEGMDFQPMQLNPQDLQLLETRTFNVLEIARWLNMPPHKLKELTRSTFTNIENEQLSYYTDTLFPWYTRWEESVKWQCLQEDEHDKYFVEFMIDSILRADIKTRNESFEIMRRNGALNADEWRAKINMNPIGGKAGDVYWMPLNVVDANSGGIMPESAQPTEEQNALPDVEQRSIRSVASRKSAAVRFEPVFRGITNSILERERREVMRIAKRTLTQRTVADFEEAIDTYYAELFPFVRGQFARAYTPYAEVIYPMAADEVNASDTPDFAFEQYRDEYTDNAALHYTNSSRGQLKSVAREAEEPIEAIEKRIGEWEATRPEKVAKAETVDGEAGFAMFVYLANAFRVRWVTVGATCPYCRSLDGRTIGRGGAFVEAGTQWEPAGAENGPIAITSSVRHPRAHEGCDCTVRASL